VGTRGSFQGLTALWRGAADGAAIHLLHQSGVYNAPYAAALLRGRQPTLITSGAANRDCSCPPGTPTRSLPSATCKHVRIAKREFGAGTRVLLDRLLHDAGIPPQSVPGPETASHLESRSPSPPASPKPASAFAPPPPHSTSTSSARLGAVRHRTTRRRARRRRAPNHRPALAGGPTLNRSARRIRHRTRRRDPSSLRFGPHRHLRIRLTRAVHEALDRSGPCGNAARPTESRRAIRL